MTSPKSKAIEKVAKRMTKKERQYENLPKGSAGWNKAMTQNTMHELSKSSPKYQPRTGKIGQRP